MPTIKITSSGTGRETTVKEYEVSEDRLIEINNWFEKWKQQKKIRHKELFDSIKMCK